MESLGEKEWFLLFQLSKMGALEGISQTTTDIAIKLFISQQTVSRRLKSLKEKGFIVNTIEGDKILIQISEKGKTALQVIYQDLKNTLIDKTLSQFYGVVQTGLGEGKFYIQLPEYNVQFTTLLKKPPFPGTLNIVLESGNLEDFYYTLSQKQYHTIHGFKSFERSYGDVKCYKIRFTSNGGSQEELECLLVALERTSHTKGTIEIVSPLNLRENFELSDGALVRIAFCD